MLKFFKSLMLVLGVMMTVGLINACTDDANAEQPVADTYTKAEVDALIGGLSDEITALRAELSGMQPNRLAAAGASTARGMQKASALTDICTPLDQNPSAAFPGLVTSYPCKSAEGMLLNMPATTSASTVRPMPLSENMFVAFESADCTGTPRVVAGDVGDFGLAQGAVFSIYETETASMRTVYVAAGSLSADFQYNSSMTRQPDGTWPCTANTIVGAEIGAVTPLDNDPTETGIQDTYQGPVSMF